ncbi:MAG TPA: hypothetical protein VF518_14725, partial [Polyangia bacterium]
MTIPLTMVGCGGISGSSKAEVGVDGNNQPGTDVSPDRAPTSEVGPVTTPDAAADTLVIPPDAAPVTTPDAVTPDATPITSPEVLPDTSIATPDAAPVTTPDALVDTKAVVPDTAKPDALVDTAIVIPDAPPITPDAPADSAPDGATTEVAEEAGPESDATPLTCSFAGGNVTADLTLTAACSPYHFTDNIWVDGATLTIEPGVTVNFDLGVALNIGSDSNAKLVAVGTAAAPILLTSSTATPEDGDWGPIYFWGSTLAGSQIAYATLDYCGAGGYGCIAATGVLPGRVTLDHLTIDHVGGGSNGITENAENSNFLITNSTFSHIKNRPAQQYAISVAAGSFAGIGSGNVFNDGAMIELQGGTIRTTTSWVDPGTSIAVTSNLRVDGVATPVLTLGAGMSLKFDTNIELDVGHATGGKLVVAGLPTKHVVLTSLASTPNPGDWVGVWVWGPGKAQLSYADISYAGADGTNPGNVVIPTGNSTAELVADHS